METNHTTEVFILGPGPVSAWTCSCGDSSQYGLRGIGQATRSADRHTALHAGVWSDDDDEQLDALARSAADAIRQIAKLSQCTEREALEAVEMELHS